MSATMFTLKCDTCEEVAISWREPSGALMCPVCAVNGRPGFFRLQTAAPASILDAALAASSAIDPAPKAKDMRVPSFEEQEAERKRMAQRIASMWGM